MAGALSRRREASAGTQITTVGPTFTASSTPGSPGSQWTVAIAPTTLAININGTPVPSTANVVELYYIDSTICQFNGTQWYVGVTASSFGTLLASGTPLPTISLSASTLPPSSASGTVIGVLSVTTGLPNGTIGTGAYTWSYALSGTGSSNFQVVGGNLQSAVANLTGGPYSLTVTATPSSTITGGPFTLAASISIGSSQSTTIPIVATPPSLGTVFHVDVVNGNDANNGLAAGSGHAWQTLQHAASTIAAGSTVLVHNGTYTVSGNANGGQVMSLNGKTGLATSWTVIKNAPGESPVIQVPQSTTSGSCGIQVQNCSYFCLQGLTVIGNSALYTASQVFADHTNPLYNANGIVIGGGSLNAYHYQVLNCTVSFCPGDGIAGQFCDYQHIEGCVVHDCGFFSYLACSGISLWQMINLDNNSGYHNLVVGNILYNNTNLVGPSGTSASGTTDGEGIIIDDNKNDQSGNAAYTGSTLIANNITYNNGSFGIFPFSDNNVDVIFNTCYQDCTNSANFGVLPMFDICWHASTTTNVFNNVIYTIPSNANVGYVGGQSFGNGTFGANNAGNNLCFNSTQGAPPGSGNVTTNPNFASTTTFVLNSGSPAKNAATASWTVATDIYGNARPGGTSNSLGAVQ